MGTNGLESSLVDLAARFAREVVTQLGQVSLEDAVSLVDGPIAPADGPRGRPSRKLAESRIARALADVSRERRLSATETHVLGLALGGAARDALSRTLGVSENTVKGWVRTMVRKLEVENIDKATLLVLHRAVALE
jgi:DNA-binding NarL/FixJ family response regulator